MVLFSASLLAGLQGRKRECRRERKQAGEKRAWGTGKVGTGVVAGRGQLVTNRQQQTYSRKVRFPLSIAPLLGRSGKFDRVGGSKRTKTEYERFFMVPDEDRFLRKLSG